jgi:glycosyltransferase involved in cell wall biosynthesis
MRDGAGIGQMRISYLCPGSLREGSALFTHVTEVARGLRAGGWTVDLFAPQHGYRGATSSFARAVSILGTQIRLVRGGRPDLLYTRWHFASFPVVLWARAFGVPVVIEVNGPYQDLFAAWPWTRRFPGLFKAMMRRQLRWAAEIISVTPGLGEYVQAEVGRSGRVVPNGANTALFRPDAAPRPGLPAAYVVFFGGLAPWHDLATMIAAVAEPGWPAGVKLVIVGGGGVQQAAVETAAAAAPDRILYLGRLPQAELARAVAPALAALVLIRQAGELAATGTFPLKLFEAMSCAVPIIVSDLRGQADIVRDADCGIVIPPEQPAALAAAVARLATAPAERRRLGANSRTYAQERCSWEKRAGEIGEILAPLVVRRGR